MRGALKARLRSYVTIILCAAVPAALAGLFWPVADIASCHGDGYSPDRYLAYCASSGYGDYEDAALYFDLEPQAIRNLRAADILVVGNSRAQVAFSTSATAAFAAAHGWRIYRFGFGYEEGSKFPERMIRRYQLRPRVIIVNADPFFTGKGSVVSNPLLSGKDQLTAYVHFLIERLAQSIQRSTCGVGRLTWLTCGEASTIYRSRVDGAWDITWLRKTQTFPLEIEDARGLDQAPRAIAVARDFLAASELSPSCLLLTTVPSDYATPLLAQQIARAVELPLVPALVNGLSTFDRSHLDALSAERWSAKFFQDAEPLIEACMRSTAARSNPE